MTPELFELFGKARCCGPKLVLGDVVWDEFRIVRQTVDLGVEVA
jgi:hypothetical protein